ncbi:MAG: hypothetical protein J6A16_02055 [Oscillospiraceae bacterium]|nr:hypothetical protein [Oscillospiraceae bacterium]
MRLYEKHPDRITVYGTEYRLTLYFDRVIRYIDLLSEAPEDAAEVGYSWLVSSPKNAPHAVKALVLDRIMSDIIYPQKRQLKRRKKNVRAVDFTIDAAEIYASFMRDYRIDLIKEQGRLHWCSFLALFQGLSEDTPIRQIMRIRTEQIPPLTRSNGDHIQRLNELKALYALPETPTEQEQADGWSDLFDMMVARAGG